MWASGLQEFPSQQLAVASIGGSIERIGCGPRQSPLQYGRGTGGIPQLGEQSAPVELSA